MLIFAWRVIRRILVRPRAIWRSVAACGTICKVEGRLVIQLGILLTKVRGHQKLGHPLFATHLPLFNIQKPLSGDQESGTLILISWTTSSTLSLQRRGDLPAIIFSHLVLMLVWSILRIPLGIESWCKRTSTVLLLSLLKIRCFCLERITTAQLMVKKERIINECQL